MSSSDTNITLSTDPNDSTNVPIMLADCYAMDRSWWNEHIPMVLILLEAIHLFPPLCRMVRRIYERRPHRPNMSELIFAWIYFFNLVGGLARNMNWYRPWPTHHFCHGTAWVEAGATHFAVAVVPWGMSQRAIAVYSQGGSRRWPFWVFTTASMVHVAWTLGELVYADKASGVEAGSCATPQIVFDESATLHFWDYGMFYYLIWAFVLDSAITASTIIKLVKNKGPFGWLGFSRLLLDNSIHYFCVVTVVNLGQIAAMFFPKSWHWSDSTRLGFAIVTVLAMYLLAKEQDYVHGYRPAGSDAMRHTIEVSNSPAGNSQPRSGGGSSGPLGSIKGALSRLISAGSPRDQEASVGGGIAEHSPSSPSDSHKIAPPFTREGSSTSMPMTTLPSMTYGRQDPPATLLGGTSIHKDTSKESQDAQRARSTTVNSKQSSTEGLGRGGGGTMVDNEGWLTASLDEKALGAAKSAQDGSPA